MKDILRLFLNEEVRVNTQWVTLGLFRLFPLAMAFLVFLLTLEFIRLGSLTDFFWFSFSFFSFVVGAISASSILLGKEATNERRIRQTSLLFTALQLLPVEPKNLMATYLLKESIFVLGFFLVPVNLGLLAGLAVWGLPLSTAAYSFISSILYFLFGLSIGYLLVGTEKLGRAKLAFLALAAAGFLLVLLFNNLVLVAVETLLFFLIGHRLPLPDFEKTTYYSKSRHFGNFDPSLTKDWICYIRTNFFLANFLYLLFVSVGFWYLTNKLLPLAFLSAALGLFSIGTWSFIVFIDDIRTYYILPVSIRKTIFSKILVFVLTNAIIGGLLIWFFVWLSGGNLPALLLLEVGISFYVFSVLANIVGFEIDKIMDVRKMLKAFVFIAPAVTIFTLLTHFLGLWAAVLSFILLVGMGLDLNRQILDVAQQA